ncbi:immunity repressor [Rhodococcus phage Shagrat]|nr:immunity repressor [Rhodococcus phage Shagrat]
MGAMTTTDTRLDLATRIRERRQELGLAQDLRPFGGPSDETVRQWERGNITETPRAKTLIGLDKALRWKPGTSSCILAGGPAQGQAVAAATTALATQWHAVPDSLVTQLVDTLDDLALQTHLSEDSDPRTTELITTAHSLAAMLKKAAEVATAR